MRQQIVCLCAILIMVFTVSIPVIAGAGDILTNKDIINMLKAGFSESIVITKIKSSKTHFDLSSDDLIILKKTGVSEKIIEKMIEKNSMPPSTLSTPSQQPKTGKQPIQTKNLVPLAKDEYYARCNLKVVKGSLITWVNWQSAPTFIPAGTRLKVTKGGKTATLKNVRTSSAYTLDIGASGNQFLEKFVTKKTVPLFTFSAPIQKNIKDAIARVGMTKEQVYIAMGPPVKTSKRKTNTLTYKEIMGEDLWIYARRRFGKNIGVAFDPSTGKVNRTEGIWGK